MRLLRGILWAALGIIGLLSSVPYALAYWQSVAQQSTGSPPSATYVSSQSLSNSGSTYTGTANIGTADANRRVVAIFGGSFSGRTVVSATINGVSSDVNITGAAANTNTNTGIVSAVVPSGTTGVTITITMSANVFSAVTCAIFTIDNSLLGSPTSPTTATGTVTAGLTATTGTLTAASGAVLIGATGWGSGSPKVLYSVTDSNSDAITVDSGATPGLLGQFHFNGLSGNITATSAWTTVNYDGSLLISAWH